MKSQITAELLTLGDNQSEMNNFLDENDDEFTTHPLYKSDKPNIKKLKVKNLRENEKLETSFDLTWKFLENNLTAIIHQKETTISYEYLYKTASNLCKVDNEAVQKKLYEFIEKNVTLLRNQLLDQSQTNVYGFIENMVAIWQNYQLQMKMIRSIFLRLERESAPDEISPVCDTFLEIFRNCCLQCTFLKTKTISDFLSLITREREGAAVDRSLIKSIFQMFDCLQIYHTELERPLLEETELFYRKECEYSSEAYEAIADQYIYHVDNCIRAETERLNYYINDENKVAIIQVTERCLILQPMFLIIDKGLKTMIDRNSHTHLKLLFELLNRVEDGQEALTNGFMTYVKNFGKDLVINAEVENVLIEELLLFRDRMMLIVSKCFGNAEKLIDALKKAFNYSINTRSNKVSDFLSCFIDSKMKNAKDVDDDELDHLMNRVITLFRFIEGKDVFGAYYRKHLARRLLMGTNISVEAEKSVVNKLKLECGEEFTYKYEGMFRDMEISEQLSSAFREHRLRGASSHTASSHMEFYVNVITTGRWPTYKTVPMGLPAQITSTRRMFEEFYLSKHKGRSIQWGHSLEHGVLTGNFRENCTKEIEVSLSQATVLLMFNECDEYTTVGLHNATKIDLDEMKKTLKSLACGKTRILLKTPMSKNIEDDDTFVVNSDLNEQLYRIKMNNIHVKKVREKNKNTEQQVHLTRQFQLDAAIVRIMKSRKEMTHAHLLEELKSQLRFPFKTSEAKKRIEYLIERDFLARDTEDSNLYKYL
ncbi:unnamed protein product [Auanema sp. JU1783]|nr:unnamed protein product [Auanema sp. JU1783]